MGLGGYEGGCGGLTMHPLNLQPLRRAAQGVSSAAGMSQLHLLTFPVRPEIRVMCLRPRPFDPPSHPSVPRSCTPHPLS